MHEVAELLLKRIRKEGGIRAGDRVAAAVSGGADSVALLCLLLELRAELGIVLSVAHVNHKLRKEESDADQRFVSELANRHGLELHCRIATVDSRRSASGKGIGIEGAARELRYAFFRQLALNGVSTKIATAHTLDDQAETVLLRIFRGTGIRGLAGIHPRIRIEEEGRTYGEVVRPLLAFRRSAIQRYLVERNEIWREDSSNQDIGFLRNRARHRLLPVISEEFGDAAIQHMSDLAELARAEEEHWELGHPEIRKLEKCANDKTRPALPLPVKLLLHLPLAAQRRMVSGWLESNTRELTISFRLVEEMLDLARGPAGNKMQLPGGWMIQVGRDHLLLKSTRSWRVQEESNYEYSLDIPGTIEVLELNTCIEARMMKIEAVPEDARGQLLDLERIPKKVLIRNWRAGDHYWPSHTAASRKVKELLSDRHATGAEKKMWPVAVANGLGLIWMRGFEVPQALRPPKEATQAIWIREVQP